MMSACTRITVRPAAVAVLALLGCASAGGPSPEARSGSNGEKHSMSKPFLFREAPLPKGFPAPGPVGKVIIKEYPAYRLARVNSKENGLSGGSDSMFRPLFNHIKRNKIAMTAPVEMGYPWQTAEIASPKADSNGMRSAESMAFLYGKPSWGQTGADPSDKRVVVEDVPAMTVLSIGVRGSYTDAKFAEAMTKLREWIASNPGQVRVAGSPRYLGYNSPLVLWFLRYAEVQLPIERIQQAEAVVDGR